VKMKRSTLLIALVLPMVARAHIGPDAGKHHSDGPLTGPHPIMSVEEAFVLALVVVVALTVTRILSRRHSDARSRGSKS
jgi:hypothetical protein